MNISASSPYPIQPVSYNTHTSTGAGSQASQATERVTLPVEPEQPIHKPGDRNPVPDYVYDYKAKMSLLNNDNSLTLAAGMKTGKIDGDTVMGLYDTKSKQNNFETYVDSYRAATGEEDDSSSSSSSATNLNLDQAANTMATSKKIEAANELTANAIEQYQMIQEVQDELTTLPEEQPTIQPVRIDVAA